MKTLKIRTVIIDDEQEARDVLETLVRRIPEIQLIETCDGAETGIRSILRHNPDLVFTDIKMPRKSGLDLLKELSEKQVKTTVVFVTAYDEYAIQAIRLAAFDFLLKPVDPDELHLVIRRYQSEKLQEEFDSKIALLLQQYKKPEKLRLNTRTGFILIDPADIVYIRADGNYSEIIFSETRKEFITQQLGTLADMLPPGKFFRTSRSSLINLDFLRKVDRKCRKCELVRSGEIFTVQVSKDIIGEFDHLIK